MGGVANSGLVAQTRRPVHKAHGRHKTRIKTEIGKPATMLQAHFQAKHDRTNAPHKASLTRCVPALI
jgi:hypothetical protein